MTDPPEGIATPSLSQVMARAGARPVNTAGLRPCYMYPPYRPVRTFGGLGQELCFTDALFRSAPQARRMLALPYEPVCRLAVSQAEWVRFPSTGTTRRRAWAAFGQPGGAFEMASASRFQELSLGALPRRPFPQGVESWMLDGLLPSGGIADDFCSILEPHEHPAVLDLVQLLAATAMEFAAQLSESGTPAAAKVVDDSIPAACVYWKREPHEYTISVSARVTGEHLNGLKFWAVFWDDDERRAVRWAYKPIEVVAPGLIVTQLYELWPNSEQSARLMTVVWEQFDALRRMVLHKADTDCFSEAVRCSLAV